MPTVEPPKQQAPMEVVDARGTAPGKVITQQPKSEPRPQLENDVSMRGGGMTLGCNCCGGMLSFHKRCC
ncbi:hypothetical protein MFIFM68171_05632 [Madurella fahalii]|uniref:Uncharacterized protein n=1 Tax=Madurella fahalii TaxID=1157608 RepID=A0ABQ0GCD9_9PEZI